MLQYEIDTPLTELIKRMGKADTERAYRVCLASIGKIANLCDQIGGFWFAITILVKDHRSGKTPPE